MRLRSGRAISTRSSRRQAKLVSLCEQATMASEDSPIPRLPTPPPSSPGAQKTPSPSSSPPTSTSTTTPPPPRTSSATPPPPPKPTLPLPPPPPTPKSTWWFCPSCRAKYPVAATRRCLNENCKIVVWTSMLARSRLGLPRAPVDALGNSTLGNSPLGPVRAPVRKPAQPRPFRRRRRAEQTKDCQVGFDHDQWRDWAEWRGKVAALRAAEAQGGGAGGEEQTGSRKRRREDEDEDEDEGSSPAEDERAAKRRREVMFVEGRYNCAKDCIWPTECKVARYTAWNEGRAKHSRKSNRLVYVGDKERKV
ncbi:hypothetical protein QBC39DRAFT_415473 [Podospora conica]|nr:hypothetical protein QBC39DRAFT_415473 [Schizothecium conicum]